MSKHIHTLPKSVINFFFVLGIVGAISFRILIFTDRISPALTKIVWYVGVIGYLLFFMFRFYISHKRRTAIVQFKLIEKINSATTLSEDDREVATYIFSSLLKSKENVNYFVIFILSFVVILLDIITNF